MGGPFDQHLSPVFRGSYIRGCWSRRDCNREWDVSSRHRTKSKMRMPNSRAFIAIPICVSVVCRLLARGPLSCLCSRGTEKDPSIWPCPAFTFSPLLWHPRHGNAVNAALTKRKVVDKALTYGGQNGCQLCHSPVQAFFVNAEATTFQPTDTRPVQNG